VEDFSAFYSGTHRVWDLSARARHVDFTCSWIGYWGTTLDEGFDPQRPIFHPPDVDGGILLRRLQGKFHPSNVLLSRLLIVYL